MVHHHRHRADAGVAHQAERLRGLVDALALVDQRRGHVFHAEPQRPATRLAHQRQVIFHLQGVVDGDLGVPARLFAERDAVKFGAGQRLDDLQRAAFVIKEVVVHAEEVADAVFPVEAPHLLGNAPAAFESVLPLVVGGDGAIGAGELTAEGHDQ